MGPCSGGLPSLRARLDPQAPGVWRRLKAEGAGTCAHSWRLPLDGEKVATQCILPYLLWTRCCHFFQAE